MEVLTPATPAGVEFGVEPASVQVKLRKAPSPRATGPLSAYYQLTKPRITFLVALSAVAGYAIGAAGTVKVLGLLHVAFGVGLLVSGTSTLNQYWERALDARMPRTQMRPLPAGLIAPTRALWFGLAMSLLAEAYLAYFINPLTAYWGFAAFASYLFLYTPLKTRTTWCTFIGAFPGALPPVLGWTAARNEVSIETLVLFGILFLWQFPHFHAIATLYREDYALAGIRMLPVVNLDGKAVKREIVGYTLVLLPVSLLPTLLHIAGPLYLAGALLLGVYFLRASLAAVKELNRVSALRLLRASVIYLPLLWILMVSQW